MAKFQSNAREKEIFEQALDRESRVEREGFIREACTGDAALFARVCALLEAHDEACQFLTDGRAVVEPASVPPGFPPADANLSERIGRYKLLQKIGEGGCGMVYLAEQEEPVRRRVALKVIKLGMDTRSVIARFEAERQALALMDHPNIARVLDAGATNTGRPFFVMELVRGTKITDYCDQHHLLTRERLDLFIKVCLAIQHAHQKGIIHRDIKPSNILVTLHDGVPVPKVIDFGIAKATADQRLTDLTFFTALDQFIGTPAYMSPEQAEMSGLDIDTRSDIYSLGVLLYELLTGKTPFDAKELAASGLDAMRRTIRETEPLRPSTRLSTMLRGELTATAQRRQTEAVKLVSLLRGDLDWIVMKCLEKDRARRYATANGLASDLQRHLNHEAVLACPPGAAYRFQKLVRRNKLFCGTAVVVAAALILGLAVSSWQMLVAQRARKGEEQQRLKAEAAQRIADAHSRQANASERRARHLLYASDMNHAQQALMLNNVGKARRLLERNRPALDQEDLRGWEWRYLWQLTRSSALTLTNRPVRGTAVSFSSDGSRLAVGWQGGRIDLWDVPGRRMLRTLTDPEARHHHGCTAFSPVRNLLASGTGFNEVILQDLDSGQEIIAWRAPEKDLWDVRDLAFSPDGSKLVVYAGSVEKLGDAAWVVDVASARTEARYSTLWSNSELHGAARLSPDNRRLYLARSDSKSYRYSIQCLDVATGQEIWETDHQKDYGLTAMALSPDGRLLASGSGFEDPNIHIWEAATGRHIARLEGRVGWVCHLTFTKDGGHLISAASDQIIRFWDTSTWNEAKVLRGHTDEVYAVAVSEAAQLVASAGKDGNLMLWKGDPNSVIDGYRRLSENLGLSDIWPLDHSRVLLRPPGARPEWVDLKQDAPPAPIPGIGTSPLAAGAFGTNTFCRWDGTNQILVHEWRESGPTLIGGMAMEPGRRPREFVYHSVRQLLAWTEEASSSPVYVASLASPGSRIELRDDVVFPVLIQFSQDGKHLAATAEHDHSLRAWNIENGQSVVSLNERVRAVAFAANGRVLVAAIEQGNNHDIGFFDLDHPGQAPRRIPGDGYATSLAVSPDGGLVASATSAGQVRLFNPSKSELIEAVHGHLHGASGVAFSPDGRRLISTSGGREAVKLWDVGTGQELLTLSGIGSMLEGARWSADGEMILAGAPWQAWRAPSWQEIAMAEANH